MPWKECHIMDERVRFVARLLDGEKMRRSAPSSGSRERPAISCTTATKIVAQRG